MPRQHQLRTLIHSTAVACTLVLGSLALPLIGASAAHAAQASPLSLVSSPKLSHASMAATRAASLAYWTPARLRAAKSADSLAPRAKAPSTTASSATAPSAAALGPAHSVAPVAPVAGVHRAAAVSPALSGTVYVSPAIGKIFFTIGSTGYACSGSSVNSDSGELVLTAGHCVYNNSIHAWASNFIYIPGYNGSGSSPYGIWSEADLVTFAGFTTGDGTLDTAFAVVTGPGLLRNVVGAMGLATGYTSFANNLFTMGYPPNSPDNQYWCDAPATVDFSSGLLFLQCTQGPGASGSPIIDGFDTSTGLGTDVSDLTLEWFNSSGTPTENSGPIFTANTWSLYEGVQAVTA